MLHEGNQQTHKNISKQENIASIVKRMKTNDVTMTHVHYQNNSNFHDDDIMSIANVLTENVTLELLDLTNNNLTDIIVISLSKSLIKNHCLTWLSLYDNRITDTGAEELASCLRDNTTLLKLSLGKNIIGEEGALKFADCLLKANSTLRVLDLRENDIGEKAKSILKEAIYHRRRWRSVFI